MVFVHILGSLIRTSEAARQRADTKIVGTGTRLMSQETSEYHHITAPDQTVISRSPKEKRSRTLHTKKVRWHPIKRWKQKQLQGERIRIMGSAVGERSWPQDRRQVTSHGERDAWTTYVDAAISPV